MRLLTRAADGSVSLVTVVNERAEKYAILSHTWGRAEDEVSFEDVESGRARNKAAFSKIEFALDQAEKDGLQYVWVDTACIHKSDPAELGEAINLMYRWYHESAVCYVYLQDVSTHQLDTPSQDNWTLVFRQSRWFTRGWTLQELIAPHKVEVFAHDRERIGTRDELSDHIENVTGINEAILRGADLETVPIQDRFAWSLGRNTQREEDMSYCLLGILDVSMTFNYGERGDRARERLMDEVDKRHGRRSGDLLRALLILSSACNGTPILRSHVLQDAVAFPSMDLRKTTIEMPLRDTCDWLTKHPTYQSWAHPETDPSSTGLLWIKGHPGAGKSTLIRHLEIDSNHELSPRSIKISFYFNARGDMLAKSTLGMYRSLLEQLIHADRAATDRVISSQLKAGHLLSASSLLTSIQRLRDLFGSIINAIAGRRIMCFIDALDECGTIEVQDMLNHFQNLTRGGSSCSRLSVCFASRYYPVLATLDNYTIRLDQQPQHLDSLRVFVAHKLRTGILQDPHSVQAQVLANANGIFIWAELVIRLLNDALTANAGHRIGALIKEMPSGLDGIYGALIQRQEQQSLDRFRLCIQCILYAQQPLNGILFHQIMYIGLLGTTEGLGTIGELSQWTSPSRGETERLVASSSRGLAQLVGPYDGKVQFIHETVRDFLIHHGGLRQLFPPHVYQRIDCFSHDRLRYICQQVLCSSEDRSIAHEPASPPAVPSLSEEPLLLPQSFVRKRYSLVDHGPEPMLLSEYASLYICKHVESAAAVFDPKNVLHSMDWARLLEYWQDVDTLTDDLYATSWRGTDAVHLFAYLDAGNLLAAAADCGHSLEIKDTEGMTPLLIACGNASTGALKSLLNAGCDINATDDVGNTAVMCLLGANHDFPKDIGSQALESLRLILAYNPSVTIRNEERNSALDLLEGHTFSTEVWTTVLQMLIDAGADIHSSDRYGKTPLMRASEWHRLDAIKILLSMKVDVNVEDENGSSALAYASESLCYDCAETPEWAQPYQIRCAQNGCLKHRVMTALIDAGANSSQAAASSGSVPYDILPVVSEDVGALFALDFAELDGMAPADIAALAVSFIQPDDRRRTKRPAETQISPDDGRRGRLISSDDTSEVNCNQCGHALHILCRCCVD